MTKRRPQYFGVTGAGLTWGESPAGREQLGELRSAIEAIVRNPPWADQVMCGRCGDWLTLGDLVGHLASEGRSIPNRVAP